MHFRFVGLVRSAGCSRAHTRRGLTLIELLVVLGIVVILAGLLIPVISGARNSARRAQTSVLINTVSTATSQFRRDHGRLPGVFTQEELASTTNQSGFTQMENAILDLAGGVDPSANIGNSSVFELALGRKTVRVNTELIAASGGPGYLPLVLKGMHSKVPEANGLAPARPDIDQVVDRSRGSAGQVEMPDILDAWGHPILLWNRNEFAGEYPRFSTIFSESEETSSHAQFYWASNRGYLASSAQSTASALGAGVNEGKRTRSMEALLGDPANPDPYSGGQGGLYVPIASRGDFVLHAAGRDGVYLTNNGEVRMEYRYSPGSLNLRVGLGDGNDRFWRYADGLDDSIVGGN